MLVIRDQQMQAFAQNAKKQFEAETVPHISRFAPRQFEILGEKTIGQIVSLGIERAEKYGFTNRGPVRFYIELMFMFGSDFDTDPQYPWAAELLGGSDAGRSDDSSRSSFTKKRCTILKQWRARTWSTKERLCTESWAPRLSHSHFQQTIRVVFLHFSGKSTLKNANTSAIQSWRTWFSAGFLPRAHIRGLQEPP